MNKVGLRQVFSEYFGFPCQNTWSNEFRGFLQGGGAVKKILERVKLMNPRRDRCYEMVR
jgi:hypothetical protein